MGGTVSQGRFSGDFDGIRVIYSNTDGFDVRLGDPAYNDYDVTVTPGSGAIPNTVDINWHDAYGTDFGAPASFNGSFPAGYGITMHRFQSGSGTTQWLYDFADIDPQYGQLYLTRIDCPSGVCSGFREVFGTIGADVIGSVPNSGSATFRSATIGYFYGSNSTSSFVDTFYATGNVNVNFQSGAVNGGFADLSWDNGAATNRGGSDLRNLNLNAHVAGGEFEGSISAALSGSSTGTLTGLVKGDFYGPTGGPITEIGGVFSLKTSNGVQRALGGFLGVKQ